MMITKTTPKGWMLTLLSALCMLVAFTACSSTENESDGQNLKPEAPISNDDWQIVPVSGGVIEKDDISIVFPSRTFTEDTKIAISEVKAGQIMGDKEVSKFYQITMPVYTNCPLTVKIKCKEQGSNIMPFVHAPTMAISEGRRFYDDIALESTYTDGEYIIQFPTFDNQEAKESESLSVGIARLGDMKEGKTREGFFIETNKIGNIEWYYNVDCFYSIQQWEKADFTKHIGDALGKLLALGLEMNLSLTESKRIVPVNITYMNEDGSMNQNEFSNRWNSISLHRDFLLHPENSNYSENKLRRSAIHEFMHIFQAEYDPRHPMAKAKAINSDWLQLYESGAVWSEKFNDGNTPSSDFISQYLPKFIRGLKEVDELYNGSTDNADQGYAMASLLEYITKYRTSESFNNQSILELYKLWSTGQPFWGGEGTSVDFIQLWVESAPHNSKLFYGNNYDDFVLSLAKGEVCEGINLANFGCTSKTFPDDKVINFRDKCYPYGCYPMRIHLEHKDFQAEGYFKEKQVIIEQDEDGVQTYALYNQDRKWIKLEGVAQKDKPLIIDGNTLESLRKEDKYNTSIYLLSTNRSNQTTIPNNVFVKIQGKGDIKPASVSPTSVSFEAEGGTDTTVKIGKGSYKYCDVEVPEEFEKWLSAKASNDGAVSITALPNTGEEREGKIKCWVSNKENPSPSDKKYIDPSVTVTQKAGDSESLLDQTDLVFPVEGGVRFIKYGFGPYLWMKKTWDDDSWLRTTWSIDYLSNIGYNPSNENRYANQLYVCCFPNETGSDREQTITFSYANEKGFDFDKGDKFPVKVKQEGGVFNLDMMKNLFVGTWYTPSDIEYNRSEGHYYHRRYTFRADNTIILEGKTTNSASKPATWDTEFTGTYSILSYEVKGDRVRVYIKVPKDDTWYKIRIERFPHFIYFAYENSDGSLWHGVYMEPE